MIQLIKQIIGFCPSCEQRTGIKGYFKRSYNIRQNTRFENDIKNFFYGCNECQKHNDLYWEEEWKNFPGY